MSTYAISKFAALALVLGACTTGEIGDGPAGPGVPIEGHAFLTVVGDRDLFLEAGTTDTLTVRYHDDGGEPLAGQVAFAIQGDAQGGVLSRAMAVTDSDGFAQIVLNAGATEEAAFRIVASAEVADAVDWRVAVTAVEPTIPLDASGTYDMKSQFDLVSGIPGPAGDVINTILDMTDDPNDPATWLIDRALDAIDSGTVRDLAGSARPALDSFLNDYIHDSAPDLVLTLLEIGDQLGQVARKFGVNSQLQVTAVRMPDTGLTGKHTMTGVSYTIDGVSYDFTMAELELGESMADGISVGLVGTTKMEIGDHTLPFAYGRVLVFALNNVIIPLIDPFASDLGDVLANRVNCYQIGWEVYEFVAYNVGDFFGILSPGLFESACEAGLDAAGNAIEAQLAGIGGEGAAFVIHGDARIADTNLDHKVDVLRTGLWEGVFRLGGAESLLARPDQKFTGTRRGLN